MEPTSGPFLEIINTPYAATTKPSIVGLGTSHSKGEYAHPYREEVDQFTMASNYINLIVYFMVNGNNCLILFPLR